MENTYWNNKGQNQKAADTLRLLLPDEGAVYDAKRNKALETFRVASNCYYDLYNNGLCNRAVEFRRVFGLASTRYRFRDVRGHWHFTDELYRLVEKRMTDIIQDAVLEQAIALKALREKTA